MRGHVDTNLILSDAQAITVTASSTNHVKLPNTTIGEGKPMYLHFGVDTAFTATSATIAVALQDSADDTTFAATELALAATATSSLVTANTELRRWPLPSDTRQYVKLIFTVATPSAATGTFDAYISDH